MSALEVAYQFLEERKEAQKKEIESLEEEVLSWHEFLSDLDGVHEFETPIIGQNRSGGLEFRFVLDEDYTVSIRTKGKALELSMTRKNLSLFAEYALTYSDAIRIMTRWRDIRRSIP